ncbi:hypothetical protein K450DRAFT_241002 [Umbelopsis ramanniana AG]|uniref:Transmembrane 9 superfamily member n=1 Tax=Umbelopsis ramanniana AG TaxID=1314678 RepID=A0AAD5E986_UMBRA|nr:uncharacterized protein K450DRAFT_241002 [Umbelopsis ramanniana AG]KAI8579681.1 hypothetical protein K450DRAFT_241002 [Umbelopsis ramanniana AG]
MKPACLLVAGILLAIASADEHNHVYEPNEEVVVWMNTIGPMNNWQETYDYYQLPFCHGDSPVQHHHETLGEALQGMDLINSGIPMSYLVPARDEPICTATLQHRDIDLFRYAIANKYWYQMFIDDLPLWGRVGRMVDNEIDSEQGNADTDDDGAPAEYIYTHKIFTIGYNEDRIIEINLTDSNPIRLDPSASSVELEFSYSVEWVPQDKDFKDRFNRFLDADFFEHKVHWFSILSSFMMVLFLTGLVAIILLRTIKRDFTRYDKEDGLGDFDRDIGEDYGWKQLHGDVFRQPPKLMLLSSLIGVGNQLMILSAVVILYTIVGDLYVERATILTATIFLYALTSGVAGYTSASYYAKNGGKDWIRNVMLTASLWPGAVASVGGFVNAVAIYYSSSRAIAFSVILAMLAIWVFLCFPLTLLGAIVGKNWAGQPDFPCRVNPIPRPIPEKLWYFEPLVVIALGGILPFGSIFIEMYFIFTSFWTYKIYYVYGFMFLVFGILLIVTACVTIVSTYFLLNSEDHRWHWMSFLTCASTSAYIYIYATYYFFSRTRMTGLFQASFYFGYTGLVCLGMFCLLGAVGHWATSQFVRKIYQNVKID